MFCRNDTTAFKKNETKGTLRVNVLFTVVEELIGRIHVWRMFVLDGMFFFFFFVSEGPFFRIASASLAV